MQVFEYNDPTTPLEVEDVQLSSRRKLAELMALNSMAPRPAYSGKAAAAQVLSGALAGMDLGNVEAKERALAERAKAARSAEMMQLVDCNA